MAKYVITIEDQDGAVAVLMAGPKKTDGAAAGYLAHELMRVAPEILSQAAQDICNCSKCQAARDARSTTSGDKPTIH